MNILSKLLGELLKYLAGFAMGVQYADRKKNAKLAKERLRIAQKWADSRNESTPDRLRRLAESADGGTSRVQRIISAVRGRGKRNS